MAIRLLIADDHEWIREGLRYALQLTEIEIVAEATTGEDAVRLASEMEVDLVLLDVTMPCGDGIEALRRIKAIRTDLPVLMYSANERSDYFQRCAELGAAGYVSKRADKREVLDSIRRAGSGERLWDSSIE